MYLLLNMWLVGLIVLLAHIATFPTGTGLEAVCECDSSLVNKAIILPLTEAFPRPNELPDAERVGDFLYITDQIGEDLRTRRLINQSVENECRRALKNVLHILRHAGCTYRNVVLFSWEGQEIEYLELIDACQGRLGISTGTPDTVYAAGRGFSVGYPLPQNASFVFDYVAYACHWTPAALPDPGESNLPRKCSCQRPYHHHAWDLPANVSAPVPPNKCFKRVSRADRNVYVTGTIGQEFLTGKVVPGGLEAQLNKSLDNIALQLAQAGCAFENVIRVETLLKDLSLAPTVNRLYEQYFGSRTVAKNHFIGSERLIKELKYEAVIQHIVDARDCSFAEPQFSVTPPEIIQH